MTAPKPGAWPETTRAFRRLKATWANLALSWAESRATRRRQRAFDLLCRSFKLDPKPLSQISHRSYCRGADDLAAALQSDKSGQDDPQ